MIQLKRETAENIFSALTAYREISLDDPEDEAEQEELDHVIELMRELHEALEVGGAS